MEDGGKKLLDSSDDIAPSNETPSSEFYHRRQQALVYREQQNFMESYRELLSKRQWHRQLILQEIESVQTTAESKHALTQLLRFSLDIINSHAFISATLADKEFLTGVHLLHEGRVVRPLLRRTVAPHHQLCGLLNIAGDGVVYYAESDKARLVGIDPHSGEVLREIPVPFPIYCFTIFEDYIAIGGQGKAMVFQIVDGKAVTLLGELDGVNGYTAVNSFCFLKFEEQIRLIVNYNSNVDSLRVYSIPDGKLLFSKSIPPGRGTRINFVAVNPVEKNLLLAGGDLRELYLLRIHKESFTLIQTITAPLGDCHMCAWSPCGRYAAAASDGRVFNSSDIILLERSGNGLSPIPVQWQRSPQPALVVNSVCFSPCGVAVFMHNNGLIVAVKPTTPQLPQIIPRSTQKELYDYDTERPVTIGATFDSQSRLWICFNTAIVRHESGDIPPLLDMCARMLRRHAKLWRTRMLPMELMDRLNEKSNCELQRLTKLNKIKESAEAREMAYFEEWKELYHRLQENLAMLDRRAQEMGYHDIEVPELSCPPPPPPLLSEGEWMDVFSKNV